ncbi:MAG: nucleotidyltransferase family protein [Lachnospiraceae bacterium]|nr:nucleotidyltransferase family protein [Lachnospiraceae bacterium]
MKVTAIIAEYNPLHSGHVTHIGAAKRETGADRIISVMSGDYVQRGAPAIISKYERARSALMSGADLVLELPLCYSTGSLDYFSEGAVSLIQKTGVAGCISFGSECGDISILKEAADLTSSLDGMQRDELKKLLSEGMSYSIAINSVIDLPDHIKDLLGTPNNLLAVSYIRAARKLSFNCEFHTVKRTGAAYHDDSTGAVSSTSIRKDILAERDYYSGIKGIPYDMNDGLSLHKILSGRIPDDVKDSLLDHLKGYPALCEDDFSLLLFYRLQSVVDSSSTSEDAIRSLTSFLDVSSALAGRIMNMYMHAPSFSALCDELKSRDLNRSRISRALMHILLSVKRDIVDEYIGDGYNYYIKPLGFLRSSSDLLHMIKDRTCVPIISKNADAASILKAHYDPASSMYSGALRMFREGISAGDLYNKTACSICRRPFISEYERSPVIISS